MYIEQYEPDFFEKFTRGEKVKPIVKYEFLVKYFNSNFNLAFGSPRTDTCQTCDRLQNSIEAEQNIDIKTVLINEKNNHLMKSEFFYSDLKEKISRTDATIEVLSYDFQQNMPFPHIPCGDVFYKRQIWSYNFCIYTAKTRFAHFFMYDVSVAKKEQNKVISFINYYFENVIDKNVKTLYLFSDNCSSQNKNYALVQYLYSIIQTKKYGIETIIQRFPEPGHSFLPCDRCFGQIEKRRRKIGRVFVPQTYQNMVKESCPRKYHVINVTQNMLYNFSEHLKPFFKKYFISLNKTKFMIMSYRIMEYTKDGLFCTMIPNSSIKEKFNPEKSNIHNVFSSEQPLPPLYYTKMKIKEAKLQDVCTLVSKYVPPEYLWFYEELEESTKDPVVSEESEDNL